MEKLFEVLKNASDGVAIANSNGQIIFWNNSLEVITGIKSQEVTGKQIWDVQAKLFFGSLGQPENYAEKIKSLWLSGEIKAIAASRERQTQEFSFKKNNEQRVIEQNFHSFVSDNETFFCAFIHDISDRKKFEGILQHDIRSPLNGVLGFLEIVMEMISRNEGSKEEILDFLGRSFLSAKKIQKTSDSYLLLEKVGRGAYPLNKKPKSISQLVDDVKKNFTYLKEAKDLKLQVSVRHPGTHILAPDLIQTEIMVDEILLDSILTNLLRNAAEAAQATKNDVLLGIYRDERFLYLDITNSGEVPKEIREKLFQKYTSNKQTGNGLGLYSASLIAHAHGGDIKYVPEPGKTTFTVSLPLK